MTMGKNLISELPHDFRKTEVDKILQYTIRGECLQIIGPAGSGKSLLLSTISQSKETLLYHLGKNVEDIYFVYLDLNLVPEKTNSEILKFILSKMGQGHQKDESMSAIAQKLDNSIRARFASGTKKITLIFDAFDTITDESLKPFFQILRALNNEYRYKLNYIFAVNREISLNTDLAKFDILGGLVTENLYYFPPLSNTDAKTYLSFIYTHQGFAINPKDHDEILRLSGNMARTIKRIVHAISNGSSLSEIKEKPSKNIILSYHLERLLGELSPEKETLKNLALGIKNPSDADNIEKLRKIYIIDENNHFTAPIFETFLKGHFSKQDFSGDTIDNVLNLKQRLTASEYKALKLLTDKMGKIVTRDELCTNIWGDKACLDVTNHAIDQLLHRLRGKLDSATPPATLQTIRGRGHRLTF